MKIDAILAELGKQMGLPNLKLDHNKVCRLIFDKKYVIDIEASSDEKIVHIYSAVTMIPPVDKEKLYEALLEANLFGRGTGGAAFGADIEMGEILLSRSIETEKTDYQDFVNILESFVNYVEAWMNKIESGEIGRDRHSTKSTTSLPSGMGPASPSKTIQDADEDFTQGPPPPGYIMA